MYVLVIIDYNITVACNLLKGVEDGNVTLTQVLLFVFFYFIFYFTFCHSKNTTLPFCHILPHLGTPPLVDVTVRYHDQQYQYKSDISTSSSSSRYD